MKKFVVIASPKGEAILSCLGLLRRSAPRNDNVSPLFGHVTQSGGGEGNTKPTKEKKT